MWATLCKTSSCTSIFCFFGAESCEAVMSHVLRLGYQYELCLPCWVPAAICRCQLSHLAAVALGCKQNQNAQIVGKSRCCIAFVFRSISQSQHAALSNVVQLPRYAEYHTAGREAEMVQAVLQEVWAYQRLQLPEIVETCRKDQRCSPEFF